LRKIGSFVVALLFLSTTLLNSNVYAQNIDTNSNAKLIITYKNNNIDRNVEKFVTNSGGQVILEMPELGFTEVKCSPNLIPSIQTYSNVESISPDTIIKLQQTKQIDIDNYSKIDIKKADLFNQYQWDIKEVTDSEKSFKLQTGNHNVIVGIIDTGVDENHPDLKANFLVGKNFVPANFENDSTETGNPDDIEDRVGHGTHIAGNGRIMGVAPNTAFKSYRVFDSVGDTSSSIISSAIVQATKDKVKVINLSVEGYDLKGKCYWTDPSTGTVYDLGNDMSDYLLYKKAIKYAVNHGVTVVTAAGNASLDCSNGKNITDYLNEQYGSQGFKYVGVGIEVPGEVSGVINVSATSKTDTLALYSNYGKGVVDIAAPGGDLNITDDNSIDLLTMCFSTYLNNSYTYMDGTSMAAPKVSAIAALIISEYGNIKPKDVAKKFINFLNR
jgi:subtilisin family serine protease